MQTQQHCGTETQRVPQGTTPTQRDINGPTVGPSFLIPTWHEACESVSSLWMVHESPYYILTTTAPCPLRWAQLPAPAHITNKGNFTTRTSGPTGVFLSLLFPHPYFPAHLPRVSGSKRGQQHCYLHCPAQEAGMPPFTMERPPAPN